MVRKTVISQLQTVGEDALEKLAQNPAARTAIQGAIQVKERGERLLHTLDLIEERLSAIEKRLNALEGESSAELADISALDEREPATVGYAGAQEPEGEFGDAADELGEDF
jgi:hypothetical protein